MTEVITLTLENSYSTHSIGNTICKCGAYHSCIGQFSYIQQAKQFGFSDTRLVQLAAAPNEAAFEGLKQEIRFLATHFYTLILYPRHELKGYQTMQFEYTPIKILEHVITNLAHMYVNIDHERDIKTRKSVSCIITAIHRVVVHWITAKQICAAAHSTDAERREFYTVIKFNEYIRCIYNFLP